MKNLLLVLTTLVLCFTACSPDADIVTPEEISTQVEELAPVPPEAADALERLISSGFEESDQELRCNNTNYGYIARDNNLVLAATLCGVRLAFFGGSTSSSAPSSVFYYHVDEKKSNGQYRRVDSGVKSGATVLWNYKVFSNVAINSGCRWRAYVYVWNPSCSRWVRLSVRYF